MRTRSPIEDLYWQELGPVLRSMVGPGVVLAAVCAAAFTLAGASPHRTKPPVSPVLQLQMLVSLPAALPSA